MFGRASRTSRRKRGRRRAGPAANSEALRLVEVRKVYGSPSAGNAVTALDDVTLSLPAGSFTAVMGPSGSGKSTLLQCAAGLDRPDSGLVLVDGAAMTGGSEAELTRFRRRRIGFAGLAGILPFSLARTDEVLPDQGPGIWLGVVAVGAAATVLTTVGTTHRALRGTAMAAVVPAA